MTDEIVETFVKCDKAEFGHLKAFYTTAAVAGATEVWKKKSVSIVSPKSGRVVRHKSHENKQNNKKKNAEQQTKEREGFFAKLFGDSKKGKVSDYTYQQSKVRKNSFYKPFWATDVTDQKPVEATLETKKVISCVERSTLVNSNNIDIKVGSPNLILAKDVEVKTPKKLLKPSVNTEYDYTLCLPPNYNGSKMFMPTGEQLFWVGNRISDGKYSNIIFVINIMFVLFEFDVAIVLSLCGFFTSQLIY